MTKKILHIAIHSWTSPVQVGSHAIAREFAKKGWDLAYIGAPITPLNFANPMSEIFRCRLSEAIKGGSWDLDGRVLYNVPFSIIAPSNRAGFRSPVLFNNWQKLSFPNIQRKISQQGFDDVDILFLDSIYQPFWIEAVRYKRLIVRLSDYNAGFSGYGAGALGSETLALRKADLVITASKDLSEWTLEQGAKDTLYVPNGVDLDRFQNPTSIPFEYKSLEGKIAVFVGVIHEWVDLELIYACAVALPDVHFVLIGPGYHSDPYRQIPQNIHILGIKYPAEIPAYLMHADLGLIPFHKNFCQRLIQHINPLKLYEYVAAGIPVVSTWWPEMEMLSSPAKLCRTKEEFISAVKQTLSEPVARDSLQGYARRTSWSNRLESLFSWIDQNV